MLVHTIDNLQAPSLVSLAPTGKRFAKAHFCDDWEDEGRGLVQDFLIVDGELDKVAAESDAVSEVRVEPGAVDGLHRDGTHFGMAVAGCESRALGPVLPVQAASGRAGGVVRLMK